VKANHIGMYPMQIHQNCQLLKISKVTTNSCICKGIWFGKSWQYKAEKMQWLLLAHMFDFG